MANLISINTAAIRFAGKLIKEYDKRAIRAVNNAAFHARNAIIKDMRDNFQSPIHPSVARGVYVNKAKAGVKPFAMVQFIGSTEEIVSVHSRGGQRPRKRLEQRLSGNKRSYYVPATATKRDKYGNIPGSKITRLLSDLQLLGEAGYSGNRRSNRSSRFFAKRARRGAPPQIIFEKRGKKKIIPLLVRVSPPKYDARLHYDLIASKVPIWAAEEFFGIGGKG